MNPIVTAGRRAAGQISTGPRVEFLREPSLEGARSEPTGMKRLWLGVLANLHRAQLARLKRNLNKLNFNTDAAMQEEVLKHGLNTLADAAEFFWRHRNGVALRLVVICARKLVARTHKLEMNPVLNRDVVDLAHIFHHAPLAGGTNIAATLLNKHWEPHGTYLENHARAVGTVGPSTRLPNLGERWNVLKNDP